MFLAFDFGQKRIGVAVGDVITASARPLPTLASAAQPDWPGIQRLLAEWRPQALVVGLPLNDDGTEQPVTREARLFAEQLRQRSQLPVHLADERFSSRAADDALRDARSSGRMSRRVRKGDRDGEAARVILEQWLADPAGGHSGPGNSEVPSVDQSRFPRGG
ncbi:MAG: Holliday junction resolvase RuvX [Panacagrimonas sp.]